MKVCIPLSGAGPGPEVPLSSLASVVSAHEQFTPSSAIIRHHPHSEHLLLFHFMAALSAKHVSTVQADLCAVARLPLVIIEPDEAGQSRGEHKQAVEPCLANEFPSGDRVGDLIVRCLVYRMPLFHRRRLIIGRSPGLSSCCSVWHFCCQNVAEGIDSQLLQLASIPFGPGIF